MSLVQTKQIKDQNEKEDDEIMSVSLLSDEEDYYDHVYKESSYRWVIVALYFMCNMANASMWITCSPIATTIKSTYSITDTYVDMASLVFMISYVIINFPANWILDDYGMRIGIFIGAFMTGIGVWIRVFVNDDFLWVIVGQTLGGIGQPFILNAPAKLATFWFKQEHRPVATAVLSLINPIGVGVGFLLPSAFVSDFTTVEKGKDQMYDLMFWQAVIFSVMCVPACIFFKKKPDVMPSKGADQEKTPTLEGFIKLFKNKNFILLLISFSSILGNFNTVATLVNIYVVPYGFSQDQAGIFGALVILFGLIGGFVGSLYVEITRKYRITIILFSIGSFITVACFQASLYSETFWVAAIAAALLGFANTPMIPLSLDFGCEITYPVGEAISTGFMMAGGNLVGIIYVLLINLVISNNDEDMTKDQVLTSNICGGAFLFVGVICNFFLKQDLRRINDELETKKSFAASFHVHKHGERDNQKSLLMSENDTKKSH